VVIEGVNLFHGFHGLYQNMSRVSLSIVKKVRKKVLGSLGLINSVAPLKDFPQVV